MMARFRSLTPPTVDPSTTDFFQQLFALARTQDPSRLVTVVGVMGGQVEWLALSDVICVNRYWGWYVHGGQLEKGIAILAEEMDGLHKRLGKPILITEFGADTIPGAHSDPVEMWSEEYQVEYLRGYLDVAAERPFMAGLHVWNFADFKTGQGSRRPMGMNFKGVFTRDRRPKMAAHGIMRVRHERGASDDLPDTSSLSTRGKLWDLLDIHPVPIKSLNRKRVGECCT